MNRKVVTLMGPTASGKTQLALRWAQRYPSTFEIIAVDSVTFFRRLDIGSAKPTPEERAQVPHHFIDILEPWEQPSSVAFVQAVWPCIEAIWKRSRIPLLVGGSPLYFKQLIEGISGVPRSDTHLRRWLQSQVQSSPAGAGLRHLRALLERLDPQAHARLHPNDTQRHMRALEVALLSGRSFLSFKPRLESSLRYRHQQGELQWYQYLLTPKRLQDLKAPIAQRLESMMAMGWLEEMQSLVQLNATVEGGLPALNSVGYKQMLLYFEGKLSLEAALEKVRGANLALAKRQLTWMKSWPEPYESLDMERARKEPPLIDFIASKN